MSDVHGGTGQAALASIYSRDLFEHGAANSQSGIGATLIGTINLPKFNLLAGGTVNVTSGINNLALNSVGPDTQIQLREIPASQEPTTTTSTTSTTGTTTTTSPNLTSGAGSVTASGVSNNYITNAFLVQTLAGSDGEFLSAGNLILTSTGGNPGPPPAPPGVVIKINQIHGSLAAAGGQPVDPQTDARIFGYDPVTGQVLRFSLDLNQSTGAVDPAFKPIQVEPPGSTAPVAVSVGRDGTGPRARLVLLVSANSRISVYDASYGTPLGSFAISPGINALGSTDTLTVAGNTTVPNPLQSGTNQLQMIDVAASLSNGVATRPADNLSNYTPPGGFTMLPGLSGLPASNRVYDLTAALFNSFTPTQFNLGLLTVETSQGTPTSTGGLLLTHQFSTISEKAFTQNGTFVPIPNPTDPGLGTSMGSIDRSLAVNTAGTKPNTIQLYGQVSLTRRGTITLNYPDQLTDLSESFRPDLAGTAIIDVQGNIQSFRGLSANGLVLNDTGNLNLVKTGLLTNSTIIGQPVGHIQTPLNNRSNVLILSSARVVHDRNGVRRSFPTSRRSARSPSPTTAPIPEQRRTSAGG